MSTPSHTDDNLIGQRLKAEMKKQGLTSAELSKRADVKTSFIYDVISGKSANPSTVTLARVAEVLGVSLTYLAGRSGPALASRQNPTNDYVSIFRIAVEASAGGGSVITEEAEGERYHFRREWIRDHLGAHPADLRLLTVRGDSMEPTLFHNDIILIDTSKKTPSPPGVFVLFDGFGLVAKRLEYVEGSGHIRLISDNAHYSTYERSPEETSIIGRVVWFAREM